LRIGINVKVKDTLTDKVINNIAKEQLLNKGYIISP